MPYPNYIDQNPRIIFFTDFDGTVTREDCLDWLVCPYLNFPRVKTLTLILVLNR